MSISVGLFDSTSLPLPPRLRLSPEMGASSDARQQAAVEPAQMLEVQVSWLRSESWDVMMGVWLFM